MARSCNKLMISITVIGCLIVLSFCIRLLVWHFTQKNNNEANPPNRKNTTEANFPVTNATLSKFTYTNNTLFYNFALNITVSNSTRCNYIAACALYQNFTFGYKSPLYPQFNVFSIQLDGQRTMPLGVDQISELKKEESVGVYHINMKFYLMMNTTSSNVYPMVYCDLHVPLKSSNETSSILGFQTTKCHSGYVDHICTID